MKKMFGVVFTFLLTALSSAAAVPYKIDAGHSDMGFTVSHLVVSKVKGRFNKYDGTFKFDPKTKKFSDFKVTIEATSIDTNEADRDKHLRSADFFDVAKFPKIEFKSAKVNAADEKSGTIDGTLTMHGVSKPVTFNYTFNGTVTDPWGNDKMGMTVTTKLNRMDYGLVWNKKLDKGGLAVGEEVTVTAEIEANAEKAAK